MAKKTISEQIQEKNNQLAEYDQQIKTIQDDKRRIKHELKALNDQMVAELGRKLLDKLDLKDADATNIEAAFKQLDNLPLATTGEKPYVND
ncbi:hypothetical protein [Leuconostoc pseudomesenteroides]|uniref:hypothetical protein n=1 Tax=Leuconostoc pseudomesenteroides TaxID=33968 RepID=UPI0040353B39